MTRRYDDQVDVRRRDDDPAEFLWRGRHYAVREVLAHWVETGAWWRTAGGTSAGAGAGGAAVGGTDGSSALALGPDSSVLSAEREVWRVEATPGRQHGAGVYDLCFDWAAGCWTLLRSHD